MVAEIIAGVLLVASFAWQVGVFAWVSMHPNSNNAEFKIDQEMEDEFDVDKEYLFEMLNNVRSCEESERAERMYDLESMLDICKDKKLKKIVSMELEDIKSRIYNKKF